MKTVSFIVPAHNEERLLGATLAALHRAAAAVDHPYEILVVDDASTDGTAAVARAHGVRVVKVALRHIAAVRNAGAAAAAGDYFVFVDADTLVDDRVVRAALRALNDGAAGGGASVRWDGTPPRWARIAALLTLFWMRVARLAAGCFMFCTREAFAASGGFNEGVFASEELFLSRALKRQGRFVLLDESVITSGRKFRTYTAGEMWRMIRALGWRPWRAIRERERLPLWYGQRRHDD